MRSLADFITTTSGFRFSVYTGSVTKKSRPKRGGSATQSTKKVSTPLRVMASSRAGEALVISVFRSESG
jgi:hypothetical protein